MENSNMSPVQVWAENAVEVEKYFLPAVLEAMRQFDAGNRTDLSILLTVTHGYKTDLVPVLEKHRMAFATPLKQILSACMPDVRFKKDDKKSSGVSYSRDFLDDEPWVDPKEARDALQMIVASGATRRSESFKEWIEAVTPPKEVAPKTAQETREKAAKDAPRLVKTAKNAGHNELCYLMGLRDALNAEIAKKQAHLAIAAE
jgi:hypothetical protein